MIYVTSCTWGEQKKRNKYSKLNFFMIILEHDNHYDSFHWSYKQRCTLYTYYAYMTYYTMTEGQEGFSRDF